MLFLHHFFIFFYVQYRLRFDEATYLSFLFKFIISKRLSCRLWRSDVLLFSDFINIVFILPYNYTEFIIFLYTYLIIFLLYIKNTWFDVFHLAHFWIHYLFLLVQVLLVIFEVFALELNFLVPFHEGYAK